MLHPYTYIDYTSSYDYLQKNAPSWAKILAQQIEKNFSQKRWGDLPQWLNILAKIPKKEWSVSCDKGIHFGIDHSIQMAQIGVLQDALMQLNPWRQGPYTVADFLIDAEWKSYMKWDSMFKLLPTLDKAFVLDIGSGNGFFTWHMLNQGAEHVIGLEPMVKNIIQFYCLKKLAPPSNNDILPITFEDMPDHLECFDVVFSMGILYHRKDPMAHIARINGALKMYGYAVIETITMPKNITTSLSPKNGLYAKMPNTTYIPTISDMKDMLAKNGFKIMGISDSRRTTSKEQRATPWMTYQSLEDFLDPKNHDLTIEGYPAPERTTFIAEKVTGSDYSYF